MPAMDKRTFLKVIAVGSTAGAMPWLLNNVQADSMKPASTAALDAPTSTF